MSGAELDRNVPFLKELGEKKCFLGANGDTSKKCEEYVSMELYTRKKSVIAADVLCEGGYHSILKRQDIRPAIWCCTIQSSRLIKEYNR